jgi:hypothetical protein
MKSAKHGKSTSKPEITNISEHGFWLFHEGREYFLDFARFPWFRKATIEQIANVQLQSASHLYWPDLDIDLSFNIIEHPDKYKLVSR